MANFIVSTSSNDVMFTIWAKQPGQNGGRPAVAERKILVKGKANIANPRTIVTPRGVVTEVTDEELAQLEKHRTFKKRVDDGFYVVHKGKRPDVREVVADMTPKDKSAPQTAKDFQERVDETAERTNSVKKPAKPAAAPTKVKGAKPAKPAAAEASEPREGDPIEGDDETLDTEADDNQE